MNLKKINRLNVGSKVKINGDDYKVIAVDRGIEFSDEVKEWILKDNSGEEYLLQLVLGESLSFWKISIDHNFKESNLIKIKTIEC